MLKRLYILYFCLYLAMIGYGISLPVIPFFLQNLAQSHSSVATNIPFHIGAITAIFAFMQMIFAPFWGWLSDLTGRRRHILLLGLGGYAFSLALTGFSPSVGWLYSARALNGIFSAAVLPVTTAYIVDIVDDRTRTKALAWHGTVVGLGVVSGPAIGALFNAFAGTRPSLFQLITFNAFSAVFTLAALLSVMAFILASIYIPESDQRLPPVPERGQFAYSTFFRSGYLMKEPLLKILAIALLAQLSLSLFEGTFVLHAQTSMYFTSKELGYIFMVCGLVMAFPQGTFVYRFIERFGAIKVLPAGLLIMAGGLSLLMAGQGLGAILIFVAILGFGMALIIPCVTVLVSQYSDSQRGSMLGLLTGANSLGQTLGPLIGSLLFTVNIHLPYLMSGLALFLGALYVNSARTQMTAPSLHDSSAPSTCPRDDAIIGGPPIKRLKNRMS
jgi:DHA1 family multidrug resistance protein-like MFS transporter